MVYNKIYAQIGEERHIVLDPVNYQYDIKQILVIQGEALPEYYEADICNVGDTATLTMIGTAADGVEIPDKFFRDGRNVLVYVVIPGSGGDVQTRYDITIPSDERAEREDIDPSEEEQQQIDSLVAALNSGVGRAEDAATAAEVSAGKAEAAAEAVQNLSVAAETLATGEPATVEKAVDEETGAVTLNFGLPRGAKGDPLTYEELTPEQKAELVQGPILEAQNAAVTAVGNARASAVDAVESAGTTQVNAVNQAGTTQTGTVNQAGAAQVTAVNQAGATQVQAVEDKGNEVLGSIPQDYTDLVDDVADLSSALNYNMQNLSGDTFAVVDFSAMETGKYILQSGSIGTSEKTAILDNIALASGQKIKLTAAGYLQNIAMIARNNGDGTYSRLVRSVDSTVRDYEYTATSDCVVCLSFYITVPYVAVIQNLVVSRLDHVEEELGRGPIDLFEELDYQGQEVGYYIRTNGSKATNADFVILDNVDLLSGQTIKLNAAGYLTNVAMIARNNGDDTYTALVASIDNDLHVYEYTAVDDCKICLSYRRLADYSAVIYNNTIPKIRELSAFDKELAVKQEISFQNEQTGYYINKNGGKSSTTNVAILDNISIKAGQLIKLTARGYSTNIAMIARHNADETYTPLAISIDSNVRDYSYTAESDMNLCLSYYLAETHKAFLYENLTVRMQNVEDFNKNLGLFSTLDFSSAQKGYYVSAITGRKTANTDTATLDDINVTAGQTVTINARGSGTNVAMIALHNADGTYTSLVRSIDSTVREYSYAVDKDCVLCLSYVHVSAYSGYVSINLKEIAKKATLNENFIQSEYVRPSIALFEKVGVVGDSYASGQIFNSSGSAIGTFYNLSWLQQIARKNGITATNYSSGGLTTRTWLTHAKGLALVNSSPAENLYIMALGLNDVSRMTDELGTIADINDADYTQNPDTFYGNYGKIYEQIKAHAPNAKFVFTTMAENGTDAYQAFNSAIIEIANHYGVPYIVQYEDPFFLSSFYRYGMRGGHPLAPVYAGMATALQRMIEKTMVDYRAYYSDYVG